MFYYCLPTSLGCGFRKAKKQSLFSHYTHWLGPHLHRLWPFGRRRPQSCTQEVVEELTDGFGYSIFLDMGQLHHATINNQGCSECEDESTLSVTEACRMRALQAGMMQRLSESVLNSLPQQSPLQCHQLPLQLLRPQHFPPGPGPAVSQDIWTHYRSMNEADCLPGPPL
nr:uncharacterized protein LOC123282114 isoform X2 [Equus asinus]